MYIRIMTLIHLQVVVDFLLIIIVIFDRIVFPFNSESWTALDAVLHR